MTRNSKASSQQNTSRSTTTTLNSSQLSLEIQPGDLFLTLKESFPLCRITFIYVISIGDIGYGEPNHIFIAQDFKPFFENYTLLFDYVSNDDCNKLDINAKIESIDYSKLLAIT